MPGPPIFQRAPRLSPELPRGEIEIPQPPAAPTEPSVSLLPVLLPGLFAIAALIASIATINLNPMASLFSFGFMGISSLVSILTFTSQKRAYSRSVRERDQKYRALLETRRQELSGLRSQQQAALLQIDPEPGEWLARVKRLDRHLWERTPQDADFLSLRLGLGMQPFAVTIRPPRQESALDPDPLIQAAQKLAKEFALVPDVPVCLPLREAGAAGLAGSRPAVLRTARALALHIAAHHSPDEVKIAALFPVDEAADWVWLRWLPHVWADDRTQRFLAYEKDAAHRLLMSLYDLLNRRHSQMTMVRDPNNPPPLPYLIFFLADSHLAENEPILHVLLTQGPSLGALPIFLADGIESLPKGCQAIVEVGKVQGRLLQTTRSPAETLFVPDDVPTELADRLARAMAPIRLQRMATPAEIPNAVPLLALLGVARVEDLDVSTRWRRSESYRSLAVPIGKRAGGEALLLDLHERGHGPHGLMAGATGSGKSELLQSLIASLAVHFHPHQVAFVLVDYKGGGMANAFLEIPHLVGTVTNLQGNLAVRALTALRSELQRRQMLLAQAGVNQIDEYQRRYRQGDVHEPLPHLVIIVDEFAELATDQPDFMKELIGAVRVGRSLGVHLILATQKPAGVVNEQIWGNARFRLCLRVERPEDSQEVLKRPDAANLTQAGRAYFQVGNNEVFELFQAAWGGAPYIPDGAVASAQDDILEVMIDGSRRPLHPSPKPSASQATGSQLQALIAYLADVAQREGIQRLPGPWLPPLPEKVILSDIRPSAGWDGRMWQPASTWLEPVVGLVDDPSRQYQGPLTLNLGKEGHLSVFGAPGTGKTGLVQTLVTSLALTHSPQDVHFYLLDFGGRLLTLFAPLPHVGGVILADETERLNRLLRYLLRELEARKERFTGAGVSTLPAYRTATGDLVPAIVVILDNYTGFATTYPDAEDQLARLAREGGNLGIHLVLTANSPSVVKGKISGNITMAVALQLADVGDYSLAVGRTAGLVPASVPGRGLVKAKPPLEFQTALPAPGETEAERTVALKGLIDQLAQAWQGPRARPVPTLPSIVPLSELLSPGDTLLALPPSGALVAPVGLDVDDLEPVKVDLYEGPHFVITGPVQSGKTTFLQTWLLALAECFSPERLQLYLVDFRRTGLFALQRLPHVRAYVEDDDRLGAVLGDISIMLSERRQALDEARRNATGVLDERASLTRYPALVLAMDDYDAIRDEAQSGTKDRLEQMVRRERGLGFHVLLAGSSADLGSSWEGLVKALKELQTGFLLGSSDHNDLGLFNLRLPMGEAGQPLPPGQGYYARRGRFRKIKAATCQAGAVTLAGWVERIVKRSESLISVPPGGAS